MDAETDRPAESAPLTVSVEPLTSGHLVQVAGELDFDSADLLKDVLDELLARRPHRLIIDCTRLAFCDSTGLNLLLKAHAAVEEAGGEMALAGPTSTVGRLLDITGVRQLFQVFPTVEGATTGDHV